MIAAKKRLRTTRSSSVLIKSTGESEGKVCATNQRTSFKQNSRNAHETNISAIALRLDQAYSVTEKRARAKAATME